MRGLYHIIITISYTMNIVRIILQNITHLSEL